MTVSSVGNVQDHRNIRASRGRSIQDIRHNFALDHSWEVPSTGHGAHLVSGMPMYPDDFRTSNTHVCVNRSTFVDPCDARAFKRPGGVYGNVESFVFDNPGATYYDMPVLKNIKLTERTTLQFRAEFFNIPNHANFGGPNSSLTSSTFGLISSAGPARELQFAMKLMW